MPDTRPSSLSIRTIEFRDPEVDFEQAVDQGEIYFVAINELTTIHPGLPDECAYDLLVEFDSETIEGTTDGPASRSEVVLNAVARIYAERYNRLVLDHLR